MGLTIAGFCAVAYGAGKYRTASSCKNAEQIAQQKATAKKIMAVGVLILLFTVWYNSAQPEPSPNVLAEKSCPISQFESPLPQVKATCENHLVYPRKSYHWDLKGVYPEDLEKPIMWGIAEGKHSNKSFIAVKASCCREGFFGWCDQGIGLLYRQYSDGVRQPQKSINFIGEAREYIFFKDHEYSSDLQSPSNFSWKALLENKKALWSSLDKSNYTCTLTT